MAKSKKKKKNTRISAEEKAALRQERSELRAKQNRKAILALGGLIICATLLIAMLVGAGSTGKKYNMAKFEQLHNGMSYAEVGEVLGADGEVANEDGSSQETPGSYIWTNRNGSSITAVFDENDTLVAAYQDGLDK